MAYLEFSAHQGSYLVSPRGPGACELCGHSEKLLVHSGAELEHVGARSSACIYLLIIFIASYIDLKLTVVMSSGRSSFTSIFCIVLGLLGVTNLTITSPIIILFLV